MFSYCCWCSFLFCEYKHQSRIVVSQIKFILRSNVITFNQHSTGEMIVSSQKYIVQETALSLYETRMTVTIRRFSKDDIGSYRCIAKNSLGEVDSSIRLYGKWKDFSLYIWFGAQRFDLSERFVSSWYLSFNVHWCEWGWWKEKHVI